MDKLSVVPIPAFKDNYIWLLHDGRQAAVVDPGDARPVHEYLLRKSLELVAILATHHHHDHVGGIAELKKPNAIPVYGPRGEPIATLTERVSEGDKVEIPQLGMTFEVLDIPGHTRAHIAYYGAKMLFCGDTLFACGCGRLFEGTAQQMHDSLSKLSALPEETSVYCGHEYTMANIAFARAVEPHNAALTNRERDDAQRRAADKPTLPSSIGLERATNPFLRVQQPEVIDAANRYLGSRAANPVQVFAALRQWKNDF